MRDANRRGDVFCLLSPAFVVPAVAALVLCAAGCDGQEDRDDPVDGGREGGTTRIEVDVVTSATPGVFSARLSDEHGGWANPACLSCHEAPHGKGFSAPECAVCHGANGATPRKEGHQDSKCKSCHEDKHDALSFSSPGDCRSCHGYQPVDGCTHTEDYDVVVIGAGGGGLSAAAALAKAGKKVLLIEQHYKVGGSMAAFTRGDYRFEASLHAFDGMGLTFMEPLGIRDRVRPVTSDIMYRAIYPDFEIDVPADVGQYRALLKGMFPDEAANIDALFDTMTDFGASVEKMMGMSIAEALESYNIKDKKLAAIITQLSGFLAVGPDDFPASMFSIMWNSYHSIGYNYFVGGSQSVSDALAEVVRENNGTIKLNTLATKIVIEDGLATGVRTEHGGCYNARYVISNANLPDTYLKLIGEEHLTPDVIGEVRSRKPARSIISMVFLGVDHDYTDLFPGNTHEIWVNVDYERGNEHLAAGECQADKSGFAIANYSTLDPDAAPPGKNVIIITALYGYDCENDWNFNASYPSYTQLKKDLARIYIDRAELYLPGLSKHIEVIDVASPHTVKGYTLNPRGSWAGADLALMDPSTGGLHAAEEQASPFANLFLAGAWVSGGGQSMALASGSSAANMVLAQE